MIDAIVGERQFADHLAPVWRAIPERVRGRFLAEPAIIEHVRALGVDAEVVQRPAPIPTYPAPRFDGRLALVASYGDVKMGRRLGYGPFVFMEHGAGQSYDGDPRSQRRSGSYAGGPDRDDNQLILVPNARCAARWRATYPAASVEVVGNPMLESLPSRQPGPGPVVALSFHWRTPPALGPEAQTALGEYLPMFPDLVKRFTVIGHAHPRGDWPATMRRYYERDGIPFVADFADVCRQADIYVCDNSSTLFEFAATGRPVVVLNSQHYRRDVEHGLRFWEAADVGMQVDRPGDLVETIQAALNDPWDQREAREAALDIVYPVRRGAAQRAAEVITAWIEERQAVAA